MRIATWNVNGIRARLEFLRIWLRDRRPDVVGLQELKVQEEDFPRDDLLAEGYASLVHCQRGWNGVAVLSRSDLGPLSETSRRLPGQDEFGARMLAADVGGLSFTTVYVPNGKGIRHEDFPRKLVWLDALCDHVAGRVAPDRPAVICGDFNLCPSGLDSWNEAALAGTLFHTEEERARFRRLADCGLLDLFRERHPSARAFSWWDYRAGDFHMGRGLRIDLVLATAAVATRVEDVLIDRDYRKKKEGLTPSDHAPVIVDLDSPDHS